MTEETRQWIVKGKVQGVAYRAYTIEKAKELNLVGWVRNLISGEVEIVAQGSLSYLAQLEEWLYKGSPSARVAEVIATSIITQQELRDFIQLPTASKPHNFSLLN